ncbi:OstA-like protein [Flavobacterium sp. NRK F10]|uniref:OstA-like protein n=1 Tax=Flavobacterium sp. NRK F10 TaxID=2954931 RepID=UPI0020905D31|nr:OstA-like protein [Flavobacterium sp. NRK F10]MCO6173766.1 OstA-like protein [Flavobacterium sp. NRK F10]
MKKLALYIISLFSCFALLNAQETKKIIVENSDFVDRNQDEIPGATVFTGNVKVLHNGVKINCNKAYYFDQENYIKAFGNVRINQGDSITLNSRYAEYDGQKELAFATGDVYLRSPESTLTTDTIYFDKKNQVAFYNSYGTIVNKENTLKSKSGKYFVQSKKYQFNTKVVVTNPKAKIETNHLDFYEESGHAYVFGPSTITNEGNVIYTENGFYDTKNNTGKLLKNSTITYDNKIIEGDDLYYDQSRNFSRAVNNVKITDTINNMVAKGHYAEMWRDPVTRKDSIILTKRAVVITKVEDDSLYMHGKKILVTGPPEDRTIRAFNNVRFYKTDMSGKCDSIHSNNKTALTQLIGNPVLWNNENQMTGDVMHLIGNNQTEQLDSLKVLNNAFLVQKDTLSQNGYNQMKGQNLFGKFRDNKLSEVDLVKNTESIYYIYNDDNELIGIDKKKCSKINMQISNNQIETVTAFDKIESNLYPESEFPENARRLRGFIWRGDERITSKEGIFPEEENLIHEQILIESRKKALEEDVPMEVLPETLEYDKNNPDNKDKKTVEKQP